MGQELYRLTSPCTTAADVVITSRPQNMPDAKDNTVKVKVNQSHYRPGQAQEGSTKFRFPDFMTTAQDGGGLSALRTGRLYPKEILLISHLTF